MAIHASVYSMSKNLTVIKLGGALLTDKQRPLTLHQPILNQVATEVRRCLDAALFDRLLLVHGVGSFGHFPVVQHRLHKGFKSPSQLIHLTYAQNSVMQLRLAIAEAFHNEGVPVCTIFPSSCMSATGSVLKSSYLDTITGFLELGMAPLIGGDVLVDDQDGFCVYSGDKIAVDLALYFGASRLILTTAVDGIYDRDPMSSPDARRFERFSLSGEGGSSAQSDVNLNVDASGAMEGKLAAIQPARDAIAAGLRVYVISMRNEGNLLALLNGERGIGTQVVL